MYFRRGSSSILSNFPSTSSLSCPTAFLNASSCPIKCVLASLISRSSFSNVESTHSRLALLSRADRSAFYNNNKDTNNYHSHASTIHVYTVEPPYKGHFGTRHFVEVVLSLDVQNVLPRYTCIWDQ